MSQILPEFLVLSLACILATGCRQPSQPAAPAARRNLVAASQPNSAPPSPTSAPAAPPPAQASAQPPKHPYRYAEPPVDEDDTAGVRGTQTVDFVVTSAGKPAEGAELRILNPRGKLEASGKTDDWGEFHPALTPGTFTITTTWQGNHTTRTIKVDATTQKIPLRLGSPTQAYP